MRIIVDIGGFKYLSYTCERCGAELRKLDDNKTLHHPTLVISNREAKQIQCEDAGAYCDKPEIVFTATSRNEP